MGIDYPPIQNSTEEPTNIPPTGSPMTIKNNNNARASVIVQGGTVTLIEFTRNESDFFPVGLLAGMFDLNPGDSLRVSYIVDPTLTQVLR